MITGGMYEIISRKRDGGELSSEEINYFITGYVNGTVPDYQVASLLMAIYIRGLSSRELKDLTATMRDSGDNIPLNTVSGIKIDKHSTGGVGDKISFTVCPLLASYGVKVPMLSGRALGHTGGTLDKLESIKGMDLYLTPEKFRSVLEATNMVVCGQTENIVPADRKIYALRDSTATVSSIPLIASSIMSKKLALGTDGLVLDVKTGSGAFIKDLEQSKILCKTMVDIGNNSGRKTIGLITNMDQPLGRTVGNSLEIIESIETLKGNGEDDIVEVTLGLGAAMLIAAGKETNFEKAYHKLEQHLATGAALDTFKQFIEAQGGDPAVCEDYSLLPSARRVTGLKAETDGYISSINAHEVGMAAIDTGAGRRKKEDPVDHGSGFEFHKRVGDQIKAGDTLVTIHSTNTTDIAAVQKRLLDAITISKEKVSKPESLLYYSDESGLKKL